MSDFHIKALQDFHHNGISYIVGAESLVGLAEGDLYKYSHHLRLYLFPTPWFKLLRLALRLLRHKIIFKPKLIQGKLSYKLRYRPAVMSKDSTFISITPLTYSQTGYVAFLGGHDTFFSLEDLNQESLATVEFKNQALNVPKDFIAFGQKYETELMSAFYKKHVVQFDSESEKKAVSFMHENVAVMKEAGIEFWIEGGTLLGALRDQKLIPWDHDLDFGMKYESETQMKDLIRKLRRHFYVSVRSFPRTSKIWHLGQYRVLKIFPRKFLFFKEDLCLDLFVYYKGSLPEEDEPVYKYVVWDRNAYHRQEFFERVDWIQFYGREVPVPAHAEKFIEVKYGENWRTPIREWNVALDDGSIYREK